MHKNILLCLLLIATVFIFSNCDKNGSNKQEPIAKVYDKVLYPSDVKDIFPANISPADSIQLLKAHLDRWVRRQLMLLRAEKNLTDEQKNVSKQLDDYKTFLLIFKYEQEYIRQKLDTVITTTEIDRFYKENIDNFILGESIVKALYIKVKKDNSYIDKIKVLYKSTKEDDVKALDNLAYQVALKYDYFNDTWISFSRIASELPMPVDNIEDYLRNNRTIEVEDEAFAYFISIRELIYKGQISPLEFEHENIKNIILNKRKQKLITDLELKIYNDARNHNQFTVSVQ
jgi:hypothetical protein